MSSTVPGRHRAPRRFAIQPLLRSSAVLVASGGLVATMSTAAQATPVAARPAAPAPAQPVSTAPTAPSTFATLPVPARHTWTTVRYGARGSTVASIQRIVGAYADGVFGPKTLAAVKRYQSRQGLVVDGIVGPITARSMGLSSASASRSTTRSSSTSGVLSVARRHMGIPYRYGGSTPSGFDCSGFTQYMFAQVGISLPRTAEAQRRATTPVSNPRPGDLVFLDYPASHAGIYAGNGYIYDSGRTGLRTQYRKMWSGNWSFRRVG